MANDDQVPPADEADRKVWHAVNFIDECEEIVRLAAEIYATEPTENFRGDKVFPFFRDAARLWAKMQREVGDGA